MRPPDRIGKPAAAEWADNPERGNLPALHFIVWVALVLGRRTARLFLYPISLYFFVFAGAARAASKGYLRKVLGREPGMRDGLRHIHSFAATILDRVFLLNGHFDKFDVRIHLDDATQAIIASQQGAILFGAHLGSFEVTRACAHALRMPPVNMVMYEENARRLNAVLRTVNPGLAQRVIALGKVDSMLKVELALQRGEFIGILADRGLEQGDAGEICDFLGAPARFPAGPWRMAHLSKRPVLLMAGVYRGGNRYDLYFELLADMNRQQEGIPRDEVLRAALQRYVARIEWHCRNAPYNWFNFYDFWK